MEDVLVIGAGISGLACAHALAGQRAVRVLEASARAGGLVRTVARDGLRWEEGPEALPPGADTVRALCAQLGLALDEAPKTAARRFLAHGTGLVEVPAHPGALLASPLFSPRGKLRLLCEPLRARGVALEGSIADFVRHRLGREFLERLVDPLVGGIHAGDVERLSLRACFPEAAELVARHGSVFAALRARARTPGAARALWKPRGGMGALVDALAAVLGERLLLGADVRELTRGPGHWRARLADGRTFEARALVLAVPLGVARRLLVPLAPEAAAALHGMQAETLVSIVHAWRRSEVGHALDGFGYLVPSSQGSMVLGTLFSSSLWPGTAPEDTVLLRTLLGGARHPDHAARSDAQLVEEVLSETRARLAARGRPLATHVARYPDVIPRFDLGHPARQATLTRALPPELFLLGNYTRGIGLARLVEEALTLARRL